MNPSKLQESGYQSRIRTSNLRLARWTGAWVAATLLMAFGMKYLWKKAVGFVFLAVGLDVAVGVGMILATINYVAELDELQRTIYLNALGITLGVALIVGIPYSMMDTYGVIPFQAEIPHLIILMGLTFKLSFRFVARRYR